MIRRACVIASLLALFGQGSPVGHMVLVEHVRCAEHGDFVHGGKGHDHGLIATAELDGAAVEGRTPNGSEATHSHCTLSSHHREAWMAPGRNPVRVALRSSAPAWTPHGDAAWSNGSARYRVAPKNSPPA